MPSEVIRVICPNLRCRSILAVPAMTRGKVVRCRKCNARVKIPLVATSAAPTPAVPAASNEQPGEEEKV